MEWWPLPSLTVLIAHVQGAPKIAHLPSLALRTDVAQVSLQTGESKLASVWSGSGGSCEAKVASVYDKQLLAICFTNAPLMKSIPKREAPLFARLWGGLLHDALEKKDAGSWADFFRFPKCVLLAPVRGGRRISHSQSLADLVNSRLTNWSEQKELLWEAVLARSQKLAARVSSPTPDLEKAVITALRLGDVRKALQLFVSAPKVIPHLLLST